MRRSIASLASAGAVIAASGLGAVGCQGDRVQSALHPAGPEAANIATLWWVMLTIYGAVFVLTMLLLVLALVAGRSERPVLGDRFIIVLGIVIPLIILTAMLFYTVILTGASPHGEPTLTIRVVGHRWWWEVRYPEHGIVTANELHIPVGATVRIELKSNDVVHSFWVPSLAGKMDLLPEHTNVMHLQADRPGVYRGQCAEFCGTQHALMAFYVVALPAEDFEQWVADRQRPPALPGTDQLLHGQRVFTTAGCAACHAVRGISTANIGPDLTHMGSRLSIGAGTLLNNHGNLAGWIANPQPLKPGNLMPQSYLAPRDLHALVAYLRSLQ